MSSQTHLSRQSLLRDLRSAAKRLQRASPGAKLSAAQDAIAQRLSFNNWSLLHAAAQIASQERIALLGERALIDPMIVPLLPRRQVSDEVDQTAAVDEMEAWVEANFVRLIDNASYDSESENGYAAGSVDLRDELGSEFGDQYGEDLIQQVAWDLEELGPWGVDPYRK